MGDWTELLDRRPVVIALAGPNGAGKSTFFEAQLVDAGLPFINADELALALRIDAYEAAGYAAQLREALRAQSSSFVFETVFSDPIGEKVEFLRALEDDGFTVLLVFVGLADDRLSKQRVAMRVAKGGHDIPDEKLEQRFPRILDNLARAIRALSNVVVFDNSDMTRPYRLVARFDSGQISTPEVEQPEWLQRALRART